MKIKLYSLLDFTKALIKNKNRLRKKTGTKYDSTTQNTNLCNKAQKLVNIKIFQDHNHKIDCDLMKLNNRDTFHHYLLKIRTYLGNILQIKWKTQCWCARRLSLRPNIVYFSSDVRRTQTGLTIRVEFDNNSIRIRRSVRQRF